MSWEIQGDILDDNEQRLLLRDTMIGVELYISTDPILILDYNRVITWAVINKKDPAEITQVLNDSGIMLMHHIKNHKGAVYTPFDDDQD